MTDSLFVKKFSDLLYRAFSKQQILSFHDAVSIQSGSHGNLSSGKITGRKQNIAVFGSQYQQRPFSIKLRLLPMAFKSFVFGASKGKSFTIKIFVFLVLCA